MLGPDMGLEGDLGIDSIKRVEIFSALQEQLPGLPEMDQGQIASLRTISDIVSHLESHLGQPTVAAPLPSRLGSASPVGVGAVLLVVVAEKTGDPAEMLVPDIAVVAARGVLSVKPSDVVLALPRRLA